ncbi:hypothetical protein WICPIJ_003442 [Wickerhamomyces pijperi]|uniref:Uncharacterized protein n=1 Tax=Wickerhamomyces pijperi TaxID=599730 RepID=A0A9P8TNV5_WICPI|nr:hypothetical protein WICPIJ_003442 [Wickerhamomyces pijperi]
MKTVKDIIHPLDPAKYQISFTRALVSIQYSSSCHSLMQQCVKRLNKLKSRRRIERETLDERFSDPSIKFTMVYIKKVFGGQAGYIVTVPLCDPFYDLESKSIHYSSCLRLLGVCCWQQVITNFG